MPFYGPRGSLAKTPPGATHGHPRPPTPLPAPAPGDRPLACCACCNLLYYALSTASSSASAPCTQGTLPDRLPMQLELMYPIPTASCTSTTHTPLPYHVWSFSLLVHAETWTSVLFSIFSLLVPWAQLLFILVFNPPPPPLILIPSSSSRSRHPDSPTPKRVMPLALGAS
ncbi:hypothetical protein GGI42DRAFT_12008 [Trichoderma sp. SZMC 28013]